MIKVRKNRYKDETSSCNDALFQMEGMTTIQGVQADRRLES